MSDKMSQEEQDIFYNLGLFEEMWVTSAVHVLRVPKGWIMTVVFPVNHHSSAFVPE